MTAYRGAQKWSKGICPMRESLGINMRVTTISGCWVIGYKDGHCTKMTTSCGDFSESGTWQPKIQSVQSVAVARTFSASVTFSPRHFSVSTVSKLIGAEASSWGILAFRNKETCIDVFWQSKNRKSYFILLSCLVKPAKPGKPFKHTISTQLSPSATCPCPPAIARWVEQAKELLAGWRSSRTQQREHVPICPRPWMVKDKKTRLKDLSQKI